MCEARAGGVDDDMFFRAIRQEAEEIEENKAEAPPEAAESTTRSMTK